MIIFWLKDGSFIESDNRLDHDVIAQDIVKDLEHDLKQFWTIVADPSEKRRS